jgi:thiosulfate reductase/polysulfide reductase chain A
MSVKDLKVSRRKFLAASGVTAAGIALSSQLSTLNAVASEHHAEKPAGKGGSKFIPSACAMCVNKCGLIAHVVDGRLKKLNPNPKFFKSRAMLCARGNAGAAIPYSPDRLKKPLLRVGKRGEGKFREISYEEAYKIVAQKLAEAKEKYKNRSTVVFASTEGFQEHEFYNLAQAFGSTNTVRHPTLCLSSTIQGWSSVYGTYPDADIHNAEFIIMVGANRAEALITPDSIDFRKGQPKGQTLVYVDPRFTKTAAKADKWYPIKPGTDLAFALALINVVITENLYDKKFVEEKTYGFDKLAEHIKQYTPEWAEKETDIPAKEIYWTARQFAKYAPRSVVYPGRRSSTYVDDVMIRRAHAILTGICGCWDTPGGVCPKGKVKLKKAEMLFPFFEQVEDRIDVASYGKFPNLLPNDDRTKNMPKDSCTYLSEKDGSWIRLRDAALQSTPYPISALIMYKQNFVESVPNRQKTIKFLEKLDFVCSIDIQVSDTALYSDLIIPESIYLERWDPAESQNGIWPIVTFRQPVIEPIYGTKSMFDIAGGIINEMFKIPSLWDDCDPDEVADFKDEAVEFFSKSMEHHIEHQLSAYKGGYEQLLKEGVFYLSDKPVYGKLRNAPRLKTKTGKVELYNVKYEGKGLDPLPVYHRPTEPKPGTYRFILGRHAWFTHSGSTNNPYLLDIEAENRMWINTKEALKLGLKSGDYAIVKSKVGQQKVKVFVTEKIRQDCVFYAHGFGHISPFMSLVYKVGASQAEILEDYIEPISGNAALHETFVTISKA